MISNTQSQALQPTLDAINQAAQLRLNANQAALTPTLQGLTNAASNYNLGTGQAADIRSPYINQGQSALNQAAIYAGATTPEQMNSLISNDAVLQNLLRQGITARNQGASATGERFSGAHAQDLIQYGIDTTAQRLNDLYNQQMGIAKLGQTSAENQAAAQIALGGNLADVSSLYGTTQGNSLLSQGEIGANAELSKATAINDAIARTTTDKAAQQALTAYQNQPKSTYNLGQSPGGSGGGGGISPTLSGTIQRTEPMGGGFGPDVTLGSLSNLGPSTPTTAGSGGPAQGSFTDANGNTYTYNAATGRVELTAPAGTPQSGTTAAATGGAVATTPEAGTVPGMGLGEGTLSYDANGNITTTGTGGEQMLPSQSILQGNMSSIEAYKQMMTIDPITAKTQAMGAYSDAYQAVQDIYKQYQAAPAKSSQKIALEQQLQSATTNLNAYQDALNTAGLWGG